MKVRVSQLFPDNQRTLLWGYTVERSSFHVYVKDGLIHVLIYRGIAPNAEVISYAKRDVFEGYDLVPSKRLYPEACDESTCRLLKDMNVHLPFTVFDDKRPEAQFHGLTFEEIPVSVQPAKTSA